MKHQRWPVTVGSALAILAGCGDVPTELTEPPEVSFSQQGGAPLVVAHGETLVGDGSEFSITARTSANGETTGSFSFSGLELSVDCLNIQPGGESALVGGVSSGGGNWVWAIKEKNADGVFQVWNGVLGGGSGGDCHAPGAAIGFTFATGQVTIRG